MEQSAPNSAIVSCTQTAEELPQAKLQPAGAPPRIELPTYRRRIREQTCREGRHLFVLSPKLTTVLMDLSKQVNVDLFVTLLATFKILLARYCRQEDIVVATPAFTGFRGGSYDIGTLHANTVALRTDLSDNPTFRELLCRVSNGWLTAGRCEEMQSRVAVVEPRPDPNITASHLPQVFFAMHKSASRDTGALKMSLDRIGSGPVGTDSELSLFAWQERENLEGVVNYNAELFDASTIESLARHFETLLENAVNDPDRRIMSLPMLTPAERRQLLVEWNATKSEYPENLCIHRLIESRVRNSPDSVAAVFENQPLTYRDLNSQANRVAHVLRKLGVEPDTLVGLCVERSLEMFVGILAILKAGGAYVPMDPTHPTKRLSTMLSDAKPHVLLTQRHLVSRFPEYVGPVIFIDKGLASVMGESDEDLGVEFASDRLAYAIFTSGSTGRPKGVLVSHKSLVNHSTAMARHYELRPGDRVLQFASLAFDVAVEEIFPTWLSGATVVLWPGVAPVKGFLEYIERQAITVLNLPAAYWHEWISESEQIRIPPMVRLVAVGSDKVSAEKLSVWKRQIGDRVRLYNAYGTTETTVTATIHEPGGNGQCGMTDYVPIGRPIANTRAYVLDQRLNLVPIGAPGELHIGGAGLARGYLNRPELTAERFILDPFCAETGERIYKTGDLVRYLPDGNLEYLGRIDNQVQLRGFRIELGEIEALLRQHPRVRDATVILREDTPGDRRLAAYLIEEPGAACTAGELRNYLRQRLPDHMLPTALVALTSFPLTPSGKIDSRALPAPDRINRESEGWFLSPRNPVERQLVNLWEELLSTRPIGIRDNFFDLGGDSLLGLKLISRLGKTFGKDFPAAILYQAATVEQLAELIIQPCAPNCAISLVPIQTIGSKNPFFWVHGDSSNAFLPRLLGPDQPLYGLVLQSQDGKPPRYTDVETIAAHYLEEIFSVQAEGPFLLGGFSFGGTVAVEMAQQLRGQGKQVAVLCLLDAAPPGDGNIKRPKKIPLGEKAKRHQRNLAVLKPREKLAYLRARARGKMAAKTARVSRILKKILCKFYLATGRPIPLFLRSVYILDIIYNQALRKYVPRPYPGPVICFKVKKRSHDPRFGWDGMAAGRLDVHELPGDHLDLIKESGVGLWAEKLKAALQAAQREANGKVPSESVEKKPMVP